MSKQNKRTVIIPDLHGQCVDKRAFELVCKAMRWWKPNRIICLGDLYDFVSLSRFRNNATALRTHLTDEVVAGDALVTEMDKWSAEEKIITLGNHEHRYELYGAKAAPEMVIAGVIKAIQETTQLGESGWEVVPYQRSIVVEQVEFVHDQQRASQYEVHRVCREADRDIVIGHLHRFDFTSRGSGRQALCPGWLGDYRQMTYRPRSAMSREWQLGFAIGETDPSGKMYLTPIQFGDYRFRLDGKWFK